mmetsp:Transcript_25214/g.39042  ORF Transcript_25214/g.39042 Transcript_25214/m.39042 type:complete len:83 (+) Transcript_25214:1004-1252(+)
MVLSQIHKLEHEERTTRVEKMLQNEQKMQEAQQMVEFYQQQIRAIDSDIKHLSQPPDFPPLGYLPHIIHSRQQAVPVMSTAG